MNLFAIIFGSSLLLFFLYFTFISIKEKEITASKRAAVLAVLLPIPYFLIPLLFDEIYSAVLIYLSIIVILVLFFPFKTKVNRSNEIPLKRYDERDIMFSRKELIPGSDRFEDYYKNNPEKKRYDDIFRSKPGLLKSKANLYDPLTFAAAKATFKTVESYWDFIDKIKQVNASINIEDKDLTLFVKKWAKKLGVVSVGVTELKDYHMYSIKGRREKYGNKVEIDHKYAIVFTVEMDKSMMDFAPGGPIVMESAQQYLHAGTIAVQIAEFIHEMGYNARAHIDGNYNVVCPLIARDAGLGEIGRMGLLMTPQLGPRVRIGVVTTDLPLITDDRKYDRTMIQFCEICKKCAENCPPKAIPFGDRKMQDGVNRWKINSESCYTYWCIIGTDCGKCMSICPYSHPNSFLHNLIRFGIRISPVFRWLALKMDDFFYGRIPTPKTLNNTDSFDYLN